MQVPDGVAWELRNVRKTFGPVWERAFQRRSAVVIAMPPRDLAATLMLKG
jgi:hypothetical protein